MVPLSWYIALSLCLFCIGLYTFISRRNLLMMFLSIEIMLNAVNISLIAISHYMQDIHGQIIAFFVIANAAAGVAVGLALL
ncbi:MAG: NADH-quinone oxidoreductase subunit NuoK, partial [Thermodesulfovibrionales bacterium]